MDGPARVEDSFFHFHEHKSASYIISGVGGDSWPYVLLPYVLLGTPVMTAVRKIRTTLSTVTAVWVWAIRILILLIH